MRNILYLFILSLIVTNCSFEKVVRHHGVSFLEKKQKNLIINKTNKNEIIEILGKPSTQSKFNNDVWIYIERKQTQSQFKNLGKRKQQLKNVYKHSSYESISEFERGLINEDTFSQLNASNIASFANSIVVASGAVDLFRGEIEEYIAYS